MNDAVAAADDTSESSIIKNAYSSSMYGDTRTSATDTSSSSSSSDCDDSEGDDDRQQVVDVVDVVDVADVDAFPTGLKRRRGATGNNNYNGVDVDNDEHEDDPTAVTETTRSKCNRVKANDSGITTSTSDNHLGPPYTLARWLEFFIGCVIFFVPIPLVVCQIVACTACEFVDQATLKLTNKGTAFNEWCDAHPKLNWKRFVHHPKDAFIVNTTIWLGLVLPAYFFVEAYAQYQSLAQGHGFLWGRAVLYNVIRIGPMYRHFMFTYVLCHKEAHVYGKFFSKKYRSGIYWPLQFVYNYFIGFFHGVLPGTFTESHIANHHKYDNDRDDVYSTGAYPRDSFPQFLRYVYIWFLYALNVSSIRKFYKEQKFARALRCFGGSLYYASGVVLAYKLVSREFAVFYILYPMVEGNILLSAVNYTWHAFIDPNDHDNDYVNSTTILEGLNFTLDEEYHVVHHQYGGVHWSRNEELYRKHIEDYKRHTATVFHKCNLFVIWGMIVAKDYEGLTEHFVQYEEDETKRLSKTELAQLLKERLQCTTWSY